MIVKCDPIHNNISDWAILGLLVNAFNFSSQTILVLWFGSWSCFFFMYLHIRETTSWRVNFFFPQMAASSGDNRFRRNCRTVLPSLSTGLFIFVLVLLLIDLSLFTLAFWFSLVSDEFDFNFLRFQAERESFLDNPSHIPVIRNAGKAPERLCYFQ